MADFVVDGKHSVGVPISYVELPWNDDFGFLRLVHPEFHAGREWHEDVEALLVGSHPDLADLALWVRELVLASESDLTERVYLGWDGIWVPSSRRRIRVRHLPAGEGAGGASAV